MRWGDEVALSVRVDRVADRAVPLNQFADSIVERVLGVISGRLDAAIRDDVVALVGVLSDRSFKINEARHLGLDAFAQFIDEPLDRIGIPNDRRVAVVQVY